MSSVPVIAIIDDDLAMREALAGLMEVLDYEPRTYDGAEAFLAGFAVDAFDVVITDLNLMGESGLELLKRLGVMAPGLPVIMISAQADPATRARALRCGAAAYLAKPIDDKVLHRHLIAALHRGDEHARAPRS